VTFTGFSKPPRGYSGTWPSRPPPGWPGTGPLRFPYGTLTSGPFDRNFGFCPYPHLLRLTTRSVQASVYPHTLAGYPGVDRLW
jgi:hypothetical protein